MSERVNVSFFQELMNSIAEQSRALLPKALFGAGDGESIEVLSRALMSGRGEASGVAIARQLLIQLKKATAEGRLQFYRFLADELQPDAAVVAHAARQYLDHPSEKMLAELQNAAYSPRMEFFRRLNLAPGATGQIVALRVDLVRHLKSDDSLAAVDRDLQRLLTSWFNRGFLVLRRIDWQTPAAILEKIIAYEAVHEIRGWDDLRRRLDPKDRRCFAFFHPALVDEPLIFVEVALTQEIPATISAVIDAHRDDEDDEDHVVPPTTAVFYSISNCQEGLKGISFGNFLLKQVVEDLVRDAPSLKTFVTLSPVPQFARWLDGVLTAGNDSGLSKDELEAVARLHDPSWVNDVVNEAAGSEEIKPLLLSLAAQYFLVSRSADERPVDPVARFHLGNGARLERLNWLADTSERGLRDGHGLMVNYRYDLGEIERNHEAYVQDGTIAASRGVRALLKSASKVKGPATIPDRLALPTASKTKRARPTGVE